MIEEGKRKTNTWKNPHVCNSKSQIYRLLRVLLFTWELCGADSMQLDFNDMKEHAMIDTSVRTIYTDNIREDCVQFLTFQSTREKRIYEFIVSLPPSHPALCGVKELPPHHRFL